MSAITPEPIEDYLRSLLPRRDRVLTEMELLAKEERIPIVGPLVGRLFYLLATTHRAKKVFELGSAIGYSTIWWARAVGPRGRVFYTDGDPKNAERASRFLRRAGVAGRVTVLVGDALTLLRATPGQFDIIFNDVDKWEYPRVFKQALPRLKEDGLLVSDNTLWSGRVADPAVNDRDTEAIRAYNQLAAKARGFVTTTLPLRDGVAITTRAPKA
jgi:predicted O-methyltransferase YrrM